MALIDLLNSNSTNLKNLKFGHDRAEGGSSNQPYVETPINIKLSNLGFLSTDFLIRGGIPGAPLAAVNDVIRLGKYFTDTKSPNGLLFIAKQLVLSRIAVQTQASGLLLNGGIYTPLSTLSQAGLGFLGTHLNKQGLNPIPNSFLSLPTYQDALHPNLLDRVSNALKRINPFTSYANIIKVTSNDVDNRLIRIYDEKYKKELGVFGGRETVYRYGGGPQSVLGIGFTRIKFATNRATGDSLRTGINGAITRKDNDKSKTWFTSNYNNSTIDYRGKENETNSKLQNFPQLPIGVSNILNDLDEISLTPQYKVSNKAKYVEKHINTHYDYSKKDAGYSTDSGVVFRNKLLLSSTKYSNSISSLTSPRTLNSSIKQLNTYGKTLSTVSDRYTLNHLQAPNPLLKIQFVTMGVNPKDTSSDPNSNYQPKRMDETEVGTLNDVDEPLNVFTYRQTDIDKIEKEELYRYNNQIKDFRLNIRARVESNNSNIDFTTANDAYNVVFGFNEFTNIIPYVSDYQTNRIENRIGVGDSGNPYGKHLYKFTKGGFTTLKLGSQTLNIDGNTGAASPTSYDKITTQKLYSNINSPKGILEKQNDLVNFRITSINNNNPSEEIYMHFRAFLGSISDNYSANWNSQKYVGRGENFYTYDGFDRKISLSFTLAAQSRVELIPMYKKLNYLISQMAPDYSGAGLMRGPLVTLTIGGYVHNQPGFITGLNVEMGEDTTWETGIDENGKMIKMSGYNLEDAYTDINPQLAHVIKVSGFSFTPIHKFAVKKAHWKNLGATPYILNSGEPKPIVQTTPIVTTPVVTPTPVTVPPSKVYSNLFPRDSIKLNKKGQEQIKALAIELLKNKNNVTIEGNASSEGDTLYNLELSQRRADAVKKALIEYGVPEDSITAVGLGEANADQNFQNSGGDKGNPLDRFFKATQTP